MGKSNRKIIFFQLIPINIYMFILFVIPIFILLAYSFWRVENFEIIKDFSLISYKNILKNKLFMNVLIRSVGIGFLVSIVGIVVSYPLAYAIAFKVKKLRDLIVFLIVISLLSNYLVKVYACRTILGNYGLINTSLMYIGIIKEPLGILLFSKFAVFIALLNILLPFIILPLYSSLLNINPEFLEAARDLGANPLISFLKITLPLSIPGIKTAFIFSFIIASGDYVIPQMLGGASGLMIGKVIADQFGITFNWSEGSALVFLLIFFDLVVFSLFIFSLNKMFLRRRKIQIEK